MSPDSSQALLAIGVGYNPIATGYTHRRRFPSDGLPFTGSPAGNLAAMAATPYMNRMMGEVGMVPMGIGHDQNVYDRMMNQRFTLMQMQAMMAASQADRDNYVKTFRGLAAVSGTPFGAEQRRAAQSLANATTMMSPLLTEMMPDFLDQMGGLRGSGAVMAKRMIDAGRYRIDPVTGRMGMSAETVGLMSNRLYGDLFSDDNLHAMRGVTAGQAGGLFHELQMRGMIGSAATGPRYGGFRGDDPRGGALRAVNDMRRTAPMDLQRAAEATGADLTRPGGISPEDLDKLNLDPRVADKLRSFDANRVKQSLKSYVSVVSAMRDIFGDMGRPNAPMSELVAGIEALTMGGVGRIDPGRMSMMVRQTYNLAKQTGVSLDNAMMIQHHAAGRASAMGIEPSFAIQAAQGGLAFGGAYRAQGHAASTAWGAMNADQVQQLDTNLRVQAASSNLANRMAVATRLSESLGGFDQGSEAGRYVSAVRSGMSEFVGGDGRVRSVMIGDREFSRMFTGATVRGGASAGISEGDIQMMLGQRDTNREFVDRFGMSNTIRRVQGTDELHPFVGHRMQEVMTSRFRYQFMRQGLGSAEATRRAREAAGAIGQRVTGRMFDMSTEEFADTATRNAGIAGFMQEELDAGGFGGVLGGLDAAGRQQFLGQTADQFYGATNRAIRGSAYRSFGSLQNVHRLTNRTTLDEADRQQMQARFTAQMQDALSPLGHGSLLQRAVDALQRARPDDPRGALGILSESLGGVRVEDINRALLPQFNSVVDKQRAVEALQAEVMKTPDAAAKARLLERLDKVRGELSGQVGKLAKEGERFGLFSADTVTHDDLTRAFNTTRGVITMQNDLSGLRGSFGAEVSDAEAMTLVGTGPGQVATLAEAKVAVLNRRRSIPYRASESAIAGVKKQFAGITDEEAFEVANMRLRSARLGVSEGEVNALVASNRERYGGAAGEMAAIGDLFAGRAAKMFDVRDADVDELRKAPGYRDPNAAEIQRFRDTHKMAGDDATIIREMQKRMVVGGRIKAYQGRFDSFWQSAEGAAAREVVDLAGQDVENVAAKLIASPQMVQRLGTRAIEMSDTLRADQQRLRELALYHSSGDVAKLVSGHLTGQFDAATMTKVRLEVAAIQNRQRGVLAELSEQEGLPGRRFQLGDETNARRAALDSEVRSGRMTQAEADKIVASTPSAHMLMRVDSMRRELGSEERARAILGIDPRDRRLSDVQRAGIAGVRFGIGSEDEAKTLYGLDRWDKLDAGERASTLARMRTGVGSDEEAMKLLGITPEMLKNDKDNDLAMKIGAVRAGLTSDVHARHLIKRSETDTDATYAEKLSLVRRGLYSVDLARERLGLSPDLLPPHLISKVAQNREEVGNEAEALRLMGKRPGDNLTQDERAKLKQVTYDVGVARRMTHDDESVLVAFEDRSKLMEKMANSRGLGVPDLEKRGDALVMTGDRKARLLAARRLQERGDTTGAEATIAADAKAAAVGSADYLSGKGWIDEQALTQFRALQGQQALERGKVDAISKSIGISPGDLAGSTDISRRLLNAQRKAADRDTLSPLDLTRDIMTEFGLKPGETPDAFQTGFARGIEGTAGRGMARRMLDTQRILRATVARRAGGAGGAEGMDEMSTAYFKAVKSGELASFRKLYGMQDVDGFGQVTAASDRTFSQFEQAMQFQQQTGLLGFGGGRNNARTRADLERLFNQAMQGGEMRPGEAGGHAGGALPSRIEMTGKVKLEGDMLDFAGAYGGGRSYVPGVP